MESSQSCFGVLFPSAVGTRHQATIIHVALAHTYASLEPYQTTPTARTRTDTFMANLLWRISNPLVL